MRAANIKSLHGFTHGGMEQVQSRYTKEADGSLSLGPNYPPEAIIELLHVSGTFSLIALRQVARLADDKGLDAEISALIDAPQT